MNIQKIQKYQLALLKSFMNGTPFADRQVVRTNFKSPYTVHPLSGSIDFDYSLTSYLQHIEVKKEVSHFEHYSVNDFMENIGFQLRDELIKEVNQHILYILNNHLTDYKKWGNILHGKSKWKQKIIAHPDFLKQVELPEGNTLEFSTNYNPWEFFRNEELDIYTCNEMQEDGCILFNQDALCIGYPRLPDKTPFYTGNIADDISHVSNRLYCGGEFGKNEYLYILDCLVGVTWFEGQIFHLRLN